MSLQEKIKKIIEHYNSPRAQFDGVPDCILNLTLEENLEIQRMIETGELVIEEKGIY